MAADLFRLLVCQSCALQKTTNDFAFVGEIKSIDGTTDGGHRYIQVGKNKSAALVFPFCGGLHGLLSTMNAEADFRLEPPAKHQSPGVKSKLLLASGLTLAQRFADVPSLPFVRSSGGRRCPRRTGLVPGSRIQPRRFSFPGFLVQHRRLFRRTPALSKIPGSEEIIKHAIEANPANRLTTTEDVAQAIAALSVPGTHFLTGNVIKVDGGEDLI
ncbi:MAG: SDR family oxidoreductase [Candidatus Dadabacteria bacterium]|nr:SDR family oxidoreductase [Candidatus Dadabacteria bacterium]